MSMRYIAAVTAVGIASVALTTYFVTMQRQPKDQNINRVLHVMRITGSDASYGAFVHEAGENISADLLVYEDGSTGFTKHINCLFPPDVTIKAIKVEPTTPDPSASLANPLDKYDGLDSVAWSGVNDIRVLRPAESGKYFCAIIPSEGKVK